ncbi:GntR family transcriptional regulator [Salinicoccus carnicancri]|uniref:GntR family transcriptional regulator n=1 Tax=Salinicoccus carnicancri TaxID=558170 RepID=UPI0002FC00FF|nr:GntR family transcriptional regulator [Salinicoccus carnicancri]
MIVKNNIASQVVDHLRKEIILGKYEKGEALVETKLSGELGVSRGPVREAIGELVTENLAEKFSNGRTAVTGFEIRDIENLYDTRILLENHALSQVSAEVFKAHEGELMSYINQMRDAEYYEDRDVETDLAFHHLLVKMSGNNSLLHLWMAQRNIFRTLIDITSEVTFTNQSEIIDQHVEIVEAMAGQDVEKAQVLLRKHLEEASGHCCNGKKLL